MVIAIEGIKSLGSGRYEVALSGDTEGEPIVTIQMGRAQLDTWSEFWQAVSDQVGERVVHHPRYLPGRKWEHVDNDQLLKSYLERKPEINTLPWI